MIGKKIKFDKVSKTIIFVLIAYLVVLLCMYLPAYIRNQKERIYIITDEFKIKYTYGNWSNITNSDDYKVEEFKFYEDGKDIGEYKTIYSNRFYLYDNGKQVKYSGTLFGYRGTLDLEYLDAKIIDSIEDSDKEIITKVFNDNSIPVDFNFNLYQKINYDLNNDGNTDSIYCISNYYMDDMEKYYSIIFTNIDGKINIVDKIITDYDGTYDEPMFKLSNLIDIRDDNKYELLYMNNYFSQSGTDCVKMYNVTKNKLIKNFCK